MVCEDCGKFGVMHENGIDVFMINNEFFAMSRCIFCSRAIEDTVDKKVAKYLFYIGVKVFNFNTGEEIVDENILDGK